MFDDQAVHVSYIIDEVKKRGKHIAEPTSAAEQQWVDHIVELAGSGAASSKFLQDCTPGYYNREGQPTTANVQNSTYVPGIIAFNKLLKDWREAGTLDGIELS